MLNGASPDEREPTPGVERDQMALAEEQDAVDARGVARHR
jgi:hypothetical protein